MVGDDTITIAPGSNFTGEVKKISESGAQAVFVSATATRKRRSSGANCMPRRRTSRCLPRATMNNSVFTAHLQGR